MTLGPSRWTPAAHAAEAHNLVRAADPRGFGWRTAFLRALCALVHAVLATVPPPPPTQKEQLDVLQERITRSR